MTLETLERTPSITGQGTDEEALMTLSSSFLILFCNKRKKRKAFQAAEEAAGTSLGFLLTMLSRSLKHGDRSDLGKLKTPKNVTFFPIPVSQSSLRTC